MGGGGGGNGGVSACRSLGNTREELEKRGYLICRKYHRVQGSSIVPSMIK